jgi:hypothetical protein
MYDIIVTISSIESQRDRVDHLTDGALKHTLSLNQLEAAIHRQTGARGGNLHTNALQIKILTMINIIAILLVAGIVSNKIISTCCNIIAHACST